MCATHLSVGATCFPFVCFGQLNVDQQQGQPTHTQDTHDNNDNRLLRRTLEILRTIDSYASHMSKQITYTQDVRDNKDNRLILGHPRQQEHLIRMQKIRDNCVNRLVLLVSQGKSLTSNTLTHTATLSSQ